MKAFMKMRFGSEDGQDTFVDDLGMNTWRRLTGSDSLVLFQGAETVGFLSDNILIQLNK